MLAARTTTALFLASFALVVSGCGSSGDGGSGDEPGGAKGTQGDSSSEPEVKSADQIAAAMGLPKAKTITITETNDPNKLLGRPNGYTSKVQVSVPAKPCKTAEDECGVSIEVFDDADSAKTRAKYIQSILKNASFLGTEYDTPNGPALLRVNGDLTPTRAKKYAADFADVLD